MRGLHEGAKVIEKHAAQLCVMAEDCNQPDYIKLVKALCADHNVSLISVPSAKTLGEWAGVSAFSFLNLICFFFSLENSDSPVLFLRIYGDGEHFVCRNLLNGLVMVKILAFWKKTIDLDFYLCMLPSHELN